MQARVADYKDDYKRRYKGRQEERMLLLKKTACNHFLGVAQLPRTCATADRQRLTPTDQSRLRQWSPARG
jgi:hypothetical protein